MKNKNYTIIKKIIFLTIVLTTLFSFDPIFAQNVANNTPAASSTKLFTYDVACIGSGNCSVSDMIDLAINLTRFMAGLIGSVALLFFILSGIKMLTSSGDSTKISSAKQMMVQTIIGMVVFFSAYLIVDFVRKSMLNDTVYQKTQINNDFQE